MKCLVLGATGLMGNAVCYGMKKLGYQVYAIDNNVFELEKLKMHKRADILSCVITKQDGSTNLLETCKYAILEYKPDIVISCLPYHLNFVAAKVCIINGIRYCDLGGNIQISEKIENFAKQIEEYKKYSAPVFTDLGLAPGLINIIVEELIREPNRRDKNLSGIYLHCGGLPVHRGINNISYGFTFGINGLINEYFNDCFCLQGGKIVKTSPMGDLRIVNVVTENLEAFNTSGCAEKTLQLMKDRGLKDYRYQTLRRPGHCKTIKFLKEDCSLDNEKIENLLKKGCPNIHEDKVYILISFIYDVNGTKSQLNHIYEIYPDQQFTAMQRATAFPTCVVADEMARGLLDKHSVLEYRHVSTNFFQIFSSGPNLTPKSLLPDVKKITVPY